MNIKNYILFSNKEIVNRIHLQGRILQLLKMFYKIIYNMQNAQAKRVQFI